MKSLTGAKPTPSGTSPLKRFRYQVAIFLAVVGPGLITANVDNDSGGILTYSQAGAKYGYLPLWTLIPITLLLIVTQEMCSRMGAVTGKGLSELFADQIGKALARNRTHAGDVLPHGCGYGQGPFRSDPRRVRLADNVLPDDRSGSDELHQCYRRIRRD